MSKPDPVIVHLSSGEILRALVNMPEGDPACEECGGGGWVNFGSEEEPCTGRCTACMPPSFVSVDGNLVPGDLEHFEKVDGKWVPRNRETL